MNGIYDLTALSDCQFSYLQNHSENVMKRFICILSDFEGHAHQSGNRQLKTVVFTVPIEPWHVDGQGVL